MPPRKRARVSQATSPTPTSQPKTPAPAESAEGKPDADEQVLNDAWTDDEEIALFKGLIRWKPTGIHKHFHLMCLHQSMLDGGHIHPRNEHTKPAGIWRKLQTLYNLEALDEREDARQLEKIQLPDSLRKETDEEESSDPSDDADVYSEAANKIENEDFSLPGADFAERKWAQRLATRKEESPPVLPELNLAEEAPVRFTPSFSIEPSEAATPTSRRGRPRAGTGGASGRPAATAAATSTRRSTRQVESAADADEGQEEEAGEEGEEGQDEGSDEEEDEGESEPSTPARRGTRSAKETRSRAASKPKPRSRAKGK